MDFWGYLVYMIFLEGREVIVIIKIVNKWVWLELIQKLECRIINLKWEIYFEIEN